MANESGTWIMYGVDWDDEECLHTVEEAEAYIEEVGFLPLFKNEIPGFSLEERTAPEVWWCDDVLRDPWLWRAVIARSGKAAYGKFFNKKAGFISREWLPAFANCRRDGYDFDALYEDGLTPNKLKKIMDLFLGENADAEISSHQLRKLAGYGKEGEKGFEGAVTSLMMKLYLINCDFRRKKNKMGFEYGWENSVYSTPEHLYGSEFVSSEYTLSPEESREKILNHIREIYPVATESQLKKVLLP